MTLDEFWICLKHVAKKRKFYFVSVYDQIRDENRCCPIVSVLREQMPDLTHFDNHRAIPLAERYLSMDAVDVANVMGAADWRTSTYREKLEAAVFSGEKNDA